MNCASNIITANFSGGKTHATTARVYQWSRGIELCITGADDLPQTFKAHFSVQKRGGVATTIVGIDERVDVPNVLFTIGKDIHVWLGASETENDAEILYTVDIPVAPAPMPEYYDAEDTGVFDAVVEQVADYAATATAAANSAGASATAAAGSASAAAASASSAAGSAGAAEQARADAVTAKGQAETAAQTATEKAQQSAQNASQAVLDAGRAESAAGRAELAETGAGAAKTAAEAAAQSAAASAATANEKATLAGQSATAAAGSASAAAQSAASIEGDVQIASQKASEAQTAAGQAVTAKDAAVTARQGAETAATNAGQSASTATAKASEAATSASNAAQSKTDAEAAAARAEQAAATLTVDTALSDSSTNPVQNKVITGEITDVKNAIGRVIETVTVRGRRDQYSYVTFGVVAGQTYTIVNNSGAYVDVRTQTSADSSGTSVQYVGNVDNGAEKTFTATGSAPAVRIGFHANGGTVEITNESTGFPKAKSDIATVEEELRYVLGLSDYNDALTWEVGSIYASGADYDTSTRAVRTPGTNKIYIGSDAVFSITNPNVTIIYAFQYNHDSGAFINRIGNGTASDITIPGGYDYRFVLIAPAGTVITTDTINTYTSGVSVLGEDISAIYDSIPDIDSNYAVDSAFCKKAKKLSAIGDVSLYQSFCIYNGKIYSTNGSAIAVQNLTTLAEENRVTLACGHGNAFQLGSANLAYISGWDDQKIYVVDLDTLTLVDTITLPTTGYTTCAVDDVNKIAYIFQLDTTPSVGGFYNFITYDYDNEQIVSTKKITFKIRAMQAVDFYNGRIVVLSGLGANTEGNRYSIFNTSGDLISEFFVGYLESIEPEGVFVDRTTFDIYLSYLVENVGYKLYKLTD